jgi:pimeloyl-ACP methyl ester carboxylesterase
VREATLQRPWGRLKVWRGGSGASILLAIHGLGGSGRYWSGLEPSVGDRFRVVAPDLIGAGGSSKPRRPYDLELFLDCLEGAVDNPDEPVVVVGHSLGGVLALLWASRNPERARGLAMIATPFPEPKPGWDPSSWKGTKASLAGAMVGTARLAWPVLSFPVQMLARYPAAVVRDYGRQTAMGRAWTLWTLWSDPALGPTVREAAGALRDGLPVLFAHAVDDRSVRPSALDRWTALMPSAHAARVASGGHQMLLRSEHAVLIGWLDGLPV